MLGDPVEALEKLRRSPRIRISQDVVTVLESRRRAEERLALRRDYETGIIEGRHPEHVTLCPLYPYQREGMLHLAFGERALLADEMGLGKTIQAIAACALLHHLGKAQRVLIVTPTSLKTEWEEQIRKFTTLSQRLIFGPRSARARYYADPAPPFFTIVNYEQVVSDSLDINTHLKPDIIVLDEAQRIKNWATKTASTNSTPSSISSIPRCSVRCSASTEISISSTQRAALPNTGTSPPCANASAPSCCAAASITSKPNSPSGTDRNHFVKLTPAINATGYAWHTGSVPQQKRRGEIIAFREDPNCRLFLSTDSGGVGLNLQHASVVINCDLPWNPARLEQRIARAWRKHQRRPVTVINLIAEQTLEHAMLESLANKMTLAEGVLDGTKKSLSKAKLKRGREANIARLQQILSIVPDGKTTPKVPPADPALAFAERARETLVNALLHCQEAILPGQSTPVLLTVLRDSTRAAAVAALFHETDWRGNPPNLHVLDESTWSAIQQMATSGLITLNTRATRDLTADAPPTRKPALTPEQLQRIAELRTLAGKKQKIAQLLLAAELPDEAETQQKAAGKALAIAHAIENHLPEPEIAEE